MFCHKCGNELLEGDRFCTKCGEPVLGEQSTKDNSNSYSENKNTFESSASGQWNSSDTKGSEDLSYEKFYGFQNNEPAADKQPTYDDFIGNKGTKKGKGSGENNKSKLIIIIAIIVIVLALAAVVVFVFVPGKTGNNGKNDSGKVVESVEETTEKATTAEPKTTVETTTPETTTQPETTTVATPYNQQIITIQPNGSAYLLTLDQWNANGTWDRVFSCEAKASTNGTSTAYGEGIRYTPSGTFDVLFCIGASQPGTLLNFVPVYNGNIWVDDTNSYYYNTLQTSGAYYQDWSSSEDIYHYFSSGENNAAIFFSYNGDGLNGGTSSYGRGSTIFLFGRYGYAGTSTDSGDILISAENMGILLSYLDSSKNPQITIY